MTDEQKKLVEELRNWGMTHQQWLTLMRFGMNTLLDDSAFLLKLIIEEAEKIQRRSETPLSGIVGLIFSELELRLVRSPKPARLGSLPHPTIPGKTIHR